MCIVSLIYMYTSIYVSIYVQQCITNFRAESTYVCIYTHINVALIVLFKCKFRLKCKCKLCFYYIVSVMTLTPE